MPWARGCGARTPWIASATTSSRPSGASTALTGVPAYSEDVTRAFEDGLGTINAQVTAAQDEAARALLDLV